jgi:microcystin-dependent protein
MSAPFLAEIRMFGFNFPPKGWAFCDGQILPISQNTALFSLLGVTYGGDGKSTFALPNMQGNAAMGAGDGTGLSPAFLGEESGVPYVTLLTSEMPVHTHSLMAQNAHAATNPDPGTNSDMALAKGTGGAPYSAQTANLTPMNFNGLPPAGGSLPHNNMQPYLTLNFCIALQGVFPARP